MAKKTFLLKYISVSVLCSCFHLTKGYESELILLPKYPYFYLPVSTTCEYLCHLCSMMSDRYKWHWVSDGCWNRENPERGLNLYRKTQIEIEACSELLNNNKKTNNFAGRWRGSWFSLTNTNGAKLESRQSVAIMGVSLSSSLYCELQRGLINVCGFCPRWCHSTKMKWDTVPECHLQEYQRLINLSSKGSKLSPFFRCSFIILDSSGAFIIYRPENSIDLQSTARSRSVL